MKRYIFQLILLYGFVTFGQNTITQAEYFIDVDPGVGFANALTLTEAATINETFTIPLTGLTQGIHILHIRVKNNVNQWGLYSRQTFYVANFSSTLNSSIIEVEYFVDVDPGVGNALPLGITSDSTLDQTFILPLNEVSEGVHVLHIRVKNDHNQWSHYARQVFYKSIAFNNKEILAAEFFIDIDPGIGNATALSLTQGQTVDETLNIPIPGDLSEGDHVLHIRVQDTNGTWSLYGRPEFTSTLSTEDFVLKNFSIHPNPVENVLYFSNQNNTIEQIKLIDLTGKIVLEITGNLNLIDMTGYTSGLYLLQIKTNNGNISKKIVKK